jgi:hypothetical protein
MAAYLQFLVSRGASAGIEIITSSGIDRMETPRTTWAAQRGLTTGYGLTTASLIRDGFVWHGHSGELMGTLSELWYLPDHGAGYFTSINSENAFDSFRIGQAIRRHLIRGLPDPPVPPVGKLPPDVAEYQGWYEPASARSQLTHFVERLTGLSLLRVSDGQLLFRSVAETRRYAAVTDARFRRVYDSPPQDPVPTLILLQTDEGRFVQMGTDPNTMRQIPAWLAVLELALLGYVLLSVMAIVLYAPFWVVGTLRRKPRWTRERALQAIPVLSVISVIAAALILELGGDDPIANFGNITVWSVALSFATVVFAGGAVVNAMVIWQTPRSAVRTNVRRFSLVVTIALLIAAAYLAYSGVIGVMTWA